MGDSPLVLDLPGLETASSDYAYKAATYGRDVESLFGSRSRSAFLKTQPQFLSYSPIVSYYSNTMVPIFYF